MYNFMYTKYTKLNTYNTVDNKYRGQLAIATAPRRDAMRPSVTI